jgi:carotenoid 1,2-hydratase
MTERRRSAVRREADRLTIGPSRLAWENGSLIIDFDEISAPIPARLKGRVTLHPKVTLKEAFQLDDKGRHGWRPFVPRADVEVVVEQPACRWRGEGYLDANAGSEPLERAFVGWDWSRVHRPRDTLIFYDVKRRGGAEAGLALCIDKDGRAQAIEAPPSFALPPTGWRMPRALRAEPADPPRLLRTLEDAPFYTRSALEGRFGGEAAQIVHERLSLDRLRAPLVRAMLPWRMPRSLL